jgi:hypothetical protein
MATGNCSLHARDILGGRGARSAAFAFMQKPGLSEQIPGLRNCVGSFPFPLQEHVRTGVVPAEHGSPEVSKSSKWTILERLNGRFL